MRVRNAFPPRVLVIAGPTASGKSDVALALAEVLPLEVICMDARTVYRRLDIGTAKPTSEEQSRVRHHCIDKIEPDSSITASDFAQMARNAIESIDPMRLPVLVGGSGFYIKATLDGLSEGIVQVPSDMREEVERDLEVRGRDALYEDLKRVDPAAAELYADKNPRRIQRALEFYRATQRPLSSTWSAKPKPYHADVLYVAVDHDSAVLRERIEMRCQNMWERGLLGEVKGIIASGIEPTAQSLQSVGYRQALDALRGESTEEDALTRMVQETWQYAKRQRTWFRKDNRYEWITGTAEYCCQRIIAMMNERNWLEA